MKAKFTIKGEISWNFLTSLGKMVKFIHFTQLQNNSRTTPERKDITSILERHNSRTLKMLAQHFLTFTPFRLTLSLVRGTNRQFYCTEVIIYNKTRQFIFFVFFDRKTILGFEMTSNPRDQPSL